MYSRQLKVIRNSYQTEEESDILVYGVELTEIREHDSTVVRIMDVSTDEKLVEDLVADLIDKNVSAGYLKIAAEQFIEDCMSVCR